MHLFGVVFNFTGNAIGLTVFINAAAAVHRLFDGRRNFLPVERDLGAVTFNYFQHSLSSIQNTVVYTSGPMVIYTIYAVSRI